MGLYLVGLGPSPLLRDLTRRAEESLRVCKRVLLDTVSAGDVQLRQDALEALLKRPVELAGPLDAEERGALLDVAKSEDLALAVAGDPLLATPYAHLLSQARRGGVDVVVVPALSAAQAALSLAGYDASQASIFVVENPGYLSAAERSRFVQMLALGAVVVLAVGRRQRIERGDWERLAVESGRHCHFIAIDGESQSLVIDAAKAT